MCHLCHSSFCCEVRGLSCCCNTHITIKGIVHPKMKIWSSAHFHVGQDLTHICAAKKQFGTLRSSQTLYDLRGQGSQPTIIMNTSKPEYWILNLYKLYSYIYKWIKKLPHLICKLSLLVTNFYRMSTHVFDLHCSPISSVSDKSPLNLLCTA